MSNNFYVTLPSNASMQYFPENTQSNWITLMNPPIELTDEWEVGLSEIHIPTKWQNIDSSNNSFKVSFLNQQSENINVEYISEIRQLTPPGVITYFENNSIIIDFPKKDKGITKFEFFLKLSEIFDDCTKNKKLANKTVFNNSIIINLKNSHKINEETRPIFLIKIEKGWFILFDHTNLDANSLSLSRLFNCLPEDLYKPIGDSFIVNKYDNMDGNDNENKYYLLDQKFYIFPPTFDVKVDLDKSIRRISNLVLETKLCFLPEGCYSTPKMLVSAINDNLPYQCKKNLVLVLTQSNNVKIISENFEFFNIVFPKSENSLGRMLGFKMSDLNIPLPYCSDDKLLNVFSNNISNQSVDINRGCSGFFVYCDLILPEYVGDTKANLLRVLPVGLVNIIVHNYSNKTHYKRLNVKYITKIHIVIKSDSDQEIEFNGGKSLCKLHFRKVQ